MGCVFSRREREEPWAARSVQQQQQPPSLGAVYDARRSRYGPGDYDSGELAIRPPHKPHQSNKVLSRCSSHISTSSPLITLFITPPRLLMPPLSPAGLPVAGSGRRPLGREVRSVQHGRLREKFSNLRVNWRDGTGRGSLNSTRRRRVRIASRMNNTTDHDEAWAILASYSRFSGIVSSVRGPILRSYFDDLGGSISVRGVWGQERARACLRSPNAMWSQSRRPLSFHIGSLVTGMRWRIIFRSLGYVSTCLVFYIQVAVSDSLPIGPGRPVTRTEPSASVASVDQFFGAIQSDQWNFMILLLESWT
jgi:hypothetical protein